MEDRLSEYVPGSLKSCPLPALTVACAVEMCERHTFHPNGIVFFLTVNSPCRVGHMPVCLKEEPVLEVGTGKPHVSPLAFQGNPVHGSRNPHSYQPKTTPFPGILEFSNSIPIKMLWCILPPSHSSQTTFKNLF